MKKLLCLSNRPRLNKNLRCKLQNPLKQANRAFINRLLMRIKNIKEAHRVEVVMWDLEPQHPCLNTTKSVVDFRVPRYRLHIVNSYSTIGAIELFQEANRVYFFVSILKKKCLT